MFLLLLQGRLVPDREQARTSYIPGSVRCRHIQECVRNPASGALQCAPAGPPPEEGEGGCGGGSFWRRQEGRGVNYCLCFVAVDTTIGTFERFSTHGCCCLATLGHEGVLGWQ